MFLRYFIISVSFVLFNCQTKTQNENKSQALKLNQVQFIGSHNSYKMAIPEALMNQIKEENSGLAESLDYSHPDIWEQLNTGLRLFELDVYYDPEGGRFSNPMGKAMVEDENWDAGFDQPGFKVFHVQDIDFLSHHALFKDYLLDLKKWSDLHPNHLPVFITLNAKDANFPERGFTEVLAFDPAAFKALDKEISDHLGLEKLMTPQEIQGDYNDLKSAVMQSGWPVLSEVRGKFIFILDEGEPKLTQYLSKDESGNGGLLFVTVPQSHPMSAIHIINDPVENHDQIKDLVEKGFIVRTRADAGTIEARGNITRRREHAFSSGAQLISTDYFVPDQRWEGGYHVQFTDGDYYRINPFFAQEIASNESLDENAGQVLALIPETFTSAEKHMDFFILDVRTKAEVDQGIISGAVNIDVLQDDFVNKIAELDKNQPVVLYCKVGGRSSKAAEIMVDKGFKYVYNLEGGYDLWKESGYPVEE
jgi:rhodanese-related sulfurtransferase